MIKADARELRERNGEDGKINARGSETKCQKSDDRAARHRDRHGGDEPDPGGKAVVGVQRRCRIRAEPDIDRVAERKLAGESHHDVPCLTRVSEVEDQDQDGQKVIVGEARRGDETDQERRDQHDTAPRHTGEQTDHVARLPRMPCGRNSSTSTRIANANMLFADGGNSKPALAPVIPIRTPAISAPGIEPRPPVMTITNASSVY